MSVGTGEKTRRPFHIPFWLGLALLIAIAGFLLWQEHRAHLFNVALVALLLACPLLHLLMHRGHGDQHPQTGHGHSTKPHDHDPTPGGSP